jgi:hypothetical protein
MDGWQYGDYIQELFESWRPRPDFWLKFYPVKSVLLYKFFILRYQKYPAWTFMIFLYNLFI